MTIVVEAGVRLAELAGLLATERQWMPIDTPRAAEATIGGLLATNWSGPRRAGYGTARDYVIGIRAVDGRGVQFKGGGRVVKNVAGYDFCKLLIGSLGTLAIVTEVTLKLRPLPEQSVTVVGECPDWNAAEKLLAEVVQLPSPLATVDLLAGTGWSFDRAGPMLVTRFEGTASEVIFMQRELETLFQRAGCKNARSLSASAADALLSRQREFSDRGPGDEADDALLVLKVAVVPSAVTGMMARLLTYNARCSLQSHASSGAIVARFTDVDAADVTRQLVSDWRPAAHRHRGALTVLSSQFEGLTPLIVWGGRSEASPLMERIKEQFDPHNVFNPGRFVFR
jgi:glycolate oxidase FAD binding subunit